MWCQIVFESLWPNLTSCLTWLQWHWWSWTSWTSTTWTFNPKKFIFQLIFDVKWLSIWWYLYDDLSWRTWFLSWEVQKHGFFIGSSCMLIWQCCKQEFFSWLVIARQIFKLMSQGEGTLKIKWDLWELWKRVRAKH